MKQTTSRRTFLKRTLALGGMAAVAAIPLRIVAQEPVSEDDPMAKGMRYTHDASTVDPSTRANPAADQNCANCALIQGNDGDEWRPCQIFPGKLVAANGWCSVWAPKA